MSAKSWKAVERNITGWLNKNGIIPAVRNSKIFMGEAVEDIAWNGFSIEVKSRGIFPKYIHEWFSQATANSKGKIPVIVWHEDNTHTGNEVVVMKINDFKTYVERNEK